MTDMILNRLAKLDACAVSDALDRLGLTGVAHGLAPLSCQRRIVGRAVTVRLGSDDGRAKKRHLCTAAVEASDQESVIVIAHQGRLDVAGWGGTLSLAAVLKKVAGVVIDGACRDLDESRELGLSIYGRGVTPVTARGRIIELEWDLPVQIVEVTVEPGDLVIADGSGVVFIPSREAEGVVAAAEAIVAKEQLMSEAVRGGDPISRVMGADYENLLRSMA